MPTPSMVTAIASIGLLLLGIVTLLWNKLDRRFDELKELRREDRAYMDKQFDRQDQQFGEVKAEIRELRALVQEALKART